MSTYFFVVRAAMGCGGLAYFKVFLHNYLIKLYFMSANPWVLNCLL